MATTPAVDLMFLLHQAGYVLQTELTAGLAEIGISPREQCVLATAQRGEHSQIQLAELCALDKTTMVVTLDRLEASGLAERRPSPGDRRTRTVAVTAAGERVVEQAEAVVRDTYDSVLAALEPAERETFVDALAKLVGTRLAEPAKCEKPPRRRR